MQLPGRLRATTLGDLLGTLHREGASGTLELTEANGRSHRVHLAAGAVTAVELDGSSPPLVEILQQRGVVDQVTLRRALLRSLSSRRLVGEVLAAEFHVAPEVIETALREQLSARLLLLEAVGDARVAFHVTVPAPPGALRDQPLAPEEFLHGRRRRRDTRSVSACDLLGVDRDASLAEIRRAFRQRARELHPDSHPHATAEERDALTRRFAVLSAAYNALVA